MEGVLELQTEFVSPANFDKFSGGCLEHQVQRLLNLSRGSAGPGIVID